MPSIGDLLAFAQPADDDDPKEVVRKNLKIASQRVLDSEDAIPDDKDTLNGRQDMWLNELDSRLTYAREYLEEAKKCDAERRLDSGVAEAMKGIGKFVKKWDEEKTDRRECKEEGERAHNEQGLGEQSEQATAVQDHSTADEAASKATTDEPESTGRIKIGPPRRQAKPPMLVVSPLPNRARPIVLDDDDEEELPQPTKKAITVTSAPPIVTHLTQCKACGKRPEPCKGPKGQRCFLCARQKKARNKSLERWGLNRWNEDPEMEKPKGKPKATVRPARGTRRKASEVAVEVSDGEGEKHDEEVDEDIAPKRPAKRAKTDHANPIAESSKAAGVRAMKRLKGRIMTMQGRIKSTEAELADIGVDMENLVGELATIEAALGMK